MILGATATIVNDGCMTPWDVIKQRMQVSHSPFRSLAHCISDTWRQGGLAAFYKSYWTTVSFRSRSIHLFSLSRVFSGNFWVLVGFLEQLESLKYTTIFSSFERRKRREESSLFYFAIGIIAVSDECTVHCYSFCDVREFKNVLWWRRRGRKSIHAGIVV